MLLNQQKRYALPLSALRGYARNLKRRLGLGKRDFNVCFVDDGAIRRMNGVYRGKDQATDVLSFPWGADGGSMLRGRRGRRARRPDDLNPRVNQEFEGFLGDIVISVDSARRNAQDEGHSTLQEIRWLILHGVLHLLGYDHECDNGEMTALELALREELGGTAGRGPSRGR
jgi:probable rRNA maturation factor